MGGRICCGLHRVCDPYNMVVYEAIGSNRRCYNSDFLTSDIVDVVILLVL